MAAWREMASGMGPSGAQRGAPPDLSADGLGKSVSRASAAVEHSIRAAGFSESPSRRER